MADFKKYFTKGLSAAEKAESNKNEIDSIFEELNSQLDEATDGKIEISRVKFYVSNALADIASLMKPRETYLAIAAKNKKVKGCDYKQLARWKIDRNGYPCVIIIDRDEMYCEDKVALESNLQQLLSDPTVGDTLYKLMSMPADAEAGDEDGGGA
ncbi:MAG: hypothetical protein RI567_10590 [Marinobacter sp.]|nr:hypothetical protein [Marinobacter sp.]